MTCRHYWQASGSLSKAQCRLCGLKVASTEQDGRWHALMPVAMRQAMRAVKHPSNTQAAPNLA